MLVAVAVELITMLLFSPLRSKPSATLAGSRPARLSHRDLPHPSLPYTLLDSYLRDL